MAAAFLEEKRSLEVLVLARKCKEPLKMQISAEPQTKNSGLNPP